MLQQAAFIFMAVLKFQSELSNELISVFSVKSQKTDGSKVITVFHLGKEKMREMRGQREGNPNEML